MIDDILQIILIICGLCLFLFIICLGESLVCNKIPFKGIVLQKSYSPESNSIGTGVGILPNGNVGTVVTSNYESEKYQLIIKINNTIVTTNTTPELFFSVKDSDFVQGYYCIGGLTKIRYCAYTLNKIGK